MDRLSLLFASRRMSRHHRRRAVELRGMEAAWDLEPQENGTGTVEPTRSAATRWNQHPGAAHSEAAVCG